MEISDSFLTYWHANLLKKYLRFSTSKFKNLNLKKCKSGKWESPLKILNNESKFLKLKKIIIENKFKEDQGSFSFQIARGIKFININCYWVSLNL